VEEACGGARLAGQAAQAAAGGGGALSHGLLGQIGGTRPQLAAWVARQLAAPEAHEHRLSQAVRLEHHLPRIVAARPWRYRRRTEEGHCRGRGSLEQH